VAVTGAMIWLFSNAIFEIDFFPQKRLENLHDNVFYEETQFCGIKI
jgi:hypothetical protein